MTKEIAKQSRRSRAQMADVARLAGVSLSTVSRALSNSPLISEETGKRIRDLAAAVNYSVDVSAKNLRGKQNKTVAVVIPFDPASHQNVSDPFFLSMVGYLADSLTQKGYQMLLSRVDIRELETTANLFFSRSAIGVLLIGQWGREEDLNRLAVRGVPLVVWGAQVPRQLYCSVGGDNLSGGWQATRHLLQRGCKRILFVGDPALQEVSDRYAGYKKALEEHGMSAHEELLMSVPFEPNVAVQDLKSRIRGGLQFDAIFACSDVLAVSLLGVLGEAGLAVPGSIKVVGYDDVDWARHATPSLTTIRQPIADAADAMINLLLAQVSGESVAPCTLPVELVERLSS